VLRLIGASMVEFLANVIGALAAGALAKSSDVGGRAVTDAYDALRAMIVRDLGGKRAVVQLLEDEPRSETAQALLAEALTKADLCADTELAQRAEALRAAIVDAPGAGSADIEVGTITAKANILVSNLVASGRIELGDLQRQTVAAPPPRGDASAKAGKRESAIRGSLRLEVSTSTSAITSGSNFSVFVTIQNPFDVPVVVYQVQTHIPVELYDINSLALYRAKTSGSIKGISRIIDRILRKDIERSQRGVAIAVGLEFSPEQDRDVISMSTSLENIDAGGNVNIGAITGLAFNFPENPTPEELDRIMFRLDLIKKGVTPTTLQPGDAMIRQFVLQTRSRLFFTPLAYSFKIQVNYALDSVDHYDTISYNVNIRSSMASVSVGAIFGALIGALLKALSSTSPAIGGASGVLQAATVAVLASLAVVIAFARKAATQPIVSVEDVWGGALIGFSVGFFGLDQFTYLFHNRPGS
jgi:hypothetical protein